MTWTQEEKKEYHQRYHKNHKEQFLRNAHLLAEKRKKEFGFSITAGHVKRKYGISFEQYREIYTTQNGLCYICKAPVSGLDHNHQTGQIRKFLCWRCNTGIGFIESSLYESLLAYIKEHSI